MSELRTKRDGAWNAMYYRVNHLTKEETDGEGKPRMESKRGGIQEQGRD
jgi:hypothetical protein